MQEPEPEGEEVAAAPPEGLSKKELKAWQKQQEKQEKERQKLLAQEEKERKSAEKKAGKKDKREDETKPDSERAGIPEPEPEPEQLSATAATTGTREPAWVAISKGELPPPVAPVCDVELPASDSETRSATPLQALEPSVSLSAVKLPQPQPQPQPSQTVAPAPATLPGLRRKQLAAAASPPVVRPIASQTVRIRYPRPSTSVRAPHNKHSASERASERERDKERARRMRERERALWSISWSVKVQTYKVTLLRIHFLDTSSILFRGRYLQTTAG